MRVFNSKYMQALSTFSQQKVSIILIYLFKQNNLKSLVYFYYKSKKGQ